MDRAERTKSVGNRQQATYTLASLNCQATTTPAADAALTLANASDVKIVKPIIANDIPVPSNCTASSMPMVMLPVPDTDTLMAIPLRAATTQCGTSLKIQIPTSVTSNAKISDDTKTLLPNNSNSALSSDELAKSILHWDDGVGTLEGCEFKFRLNELGCLEIIDSEDSNDKDYTNDWPKKGSVKKLSAGSSLLAKPVKYNQNSMTKKLSSAQTLNNNNNNNPSSLAITPVSQATTPPLNDNSFLLCKLLPSDKLEELCVDNIEQWSAEQVEKFINSIPGCEGLGELFVDQQICGKSLMLLTQRDLLDIFYIKLGPAVKIYNAILLVRNRLKSKTEFSRE